MRCVILAGGLGSRMAPFTSVIPKALIPVNGEPFLRLKLRQLSENGVTDVVISVGHLGDLVESAVAEMPLGGMNVAVVHDGPQLLGTAGALRRLMDLERLDDAFLVTYGDSFLSYDHAAVIRAFNGNKFNGLLTVWQDMTGSELGNCSVSGDRVTEYCKEVRTGHRLPWIDYGLIILKSSVVKELIPTGVPADLGTILSTLASQGNLQAHRVPERFYEIGSPAGLEALERVLSREVR